ncbi:TRAP transporter substrate-binding protein [Thermodesulfobacteriota bacterium]
MKNSKWFVFVIVLMVAMLIPASGFCQKTINLKYSLSLSNSHPFSQVLVRWFDRLEKQTNGRLKTQFFPRYTLLTSKGGWEELRAGAANMGSIQIAYQRSGFDLLRRVPSFYFGVQDFKKARRINEDVRKKFPFIEDDAKGNKILMRQQYPGYSAFTRKGNPIRTLDNFKGLSLKVTSTHLSWAKALGAEGIVMPMGEVYISLEKGILDGYLGPIESLNSMKLAEVTSYATYCYVNSGPNPTCFMNWDTWNKLPPDIQKLIDDTMDEAVADDEATKEKLTEDAVAKAKKQGMEFIKMPKADYAKLNTVLEQTFIKKAKELDAKGFPGTEIYKYIRGLVEKYND